MLRAYAAVAAILACAFCRAAAFAQTPSPQPSFEGIELGETLAAVHARLGDPIAIRPQLRGGTIWRYPSANGAYWIDVLQTNNLVKAVTVMHGSGAYTDPQGVAMGSTFESVEKRLGLPTRVFAHAADHATDLFYATSAAIWVYNVSGEDHLISIRLDAAQATPSTPGPDVTLGDGSTPALAIKPLVTASQAGAWPGTYVASKTCAGDYTYWTPGTESKRISGGKTYTVVSAACSATGAQRDFFFDLSQH